MKSKKSVVNHLFQELFTMCCHSDNNQRSRKIMLVGEIIAQAVREGRLLKSLTKDVKDYGESEQ